jgi:hypothetical protein
MRAIAATIVSNPRPPQDLNFLLALSPGYHPERSEAPRSDSAATLAPRGTRPTAPTFRVGRILGVLGPVDSAASPMGSGSFLTGEC